MSNDKTLATGHEASVADLQSADEAIFCSIKGDDLDSKKAIYNAISNSEKLSEQVGSILRIKDVIAQNVTMENDKTGESGPAVRIVLITDEGRAFGCVSSGIMNSLTNMFAILGTPETWAEPMDMAVKEKSGRRGYKFLTLELA